MINYIWYVVNNGGSVDITCKYNEALGRLECDDFNTLMNKFYEDAKAYNEELLDTTWAECTLRQWMNDDFLNSAFTLAWSISPVSGSDANRMHPNPNCDSF